MKKILSYIALVLLAPFRFVIAKNKRWYVKIFRWLVSLFVLFVFYIFAVTINLFCLFGYTPSFEDIKNPKQNIATEIYASNNEYLGRYFYENRSPVTFEELPKTLIKTLVAVEDFRFYRHMGIDFKAIPSVISDVAKGKRRGGSTITQQLVKNLYKTRQQDHGYLGNIPFFRMFVIKTKEWISAIKIELFFSKNEILVHYLNTVDFGSNAYGIKTAAKTYFNKLPMDLYPIECATLVGMLKAPSAYNPVLNPENAVERRNVVLDVMCDHYIISPYEKEMFSNFPIELSYSVEKTNDGIANYYRRKVIKELKPWLEANNYDIYADGLKIYTSLDFSMQKYAEEAVAENSARLQRLFYKHCKTVAPWVDSKKKEIPNFINTVVEKSWYYSELSAKYNGNKDSINYYLHKQEERTLFSWQGEIDTVCSFVEATDYLKRLLHAGFVALDPQTGSVKAYVGGIDYNHFKHDKVTAKRQPGSCFKPFVYACAMENGYTPCDSIPDVPITINYVEKGENKTWSPRNANWKNVGGNVPLKYALAHSLNTVTAQLSQKLTTEKIIEFAYRMGVESSLDTVPALCLGSSEMNLLELTNAYSPFINGGYKVEPFFVTRIEDNNGNLLAEFLPKKEKVLNDTVVFFMQQLFLNNVEEDSSTTQALFSFDIFKYKTDFTGKTGTSSNYSDGWFVGVSPKIVAGSWVGAEERSVHFRTSATGEGNKTALPAYGIFMEKLMQDTAFAYLQAKFDRKMAGINGRFGCKVKKVQIAVVDTLPKEEKVVVETSVEKKVVTTPKKKQPTKKVTKPSKPTNKDNGVIRSTKDNENGAKPTTQQKEVKKVEQSKPAPKKKTIKVNIHNINKHVIYPGMEDDK